MERNKALKENSRNLRLNQTKEEALLWYRFLRNDPLRFRRQYIIGNYIVDFYCHKARLAVEPDGSGHYTPEIMEYDSRRTIYLQGQDVQVLRFTNLEVMREFDNVCAHIHATAEQRAAHGSSRGGAVSEAD